MSETKGHPVSSCLPAPAQLSPSPADNRLPVIRFNLLPWGRTTPHLLPPEPQENPRRSKDHKTGISIPLPLLWVLSFGPDTGRVGRTSGNPRPPPQPVPTHLPLGFIEDAVHGVEQGHALVEFEHLLLGQLQTEAQTDVGQLGPERRWARGLGMGGTGLGGGGLLRGDPRWG